MLSNCKSGKCNQDVFLIYYLSAREDVLLREQPVLLFITIDNLLKRKCLRNSLFLWLTLLVQVFNYFHKNFETFHIRYSIFILWMTSYTSKCRFSWAFIWYKIHFCIYRVCALPPSWKNTFMHFVVVKYVTFFLIHFLGFKLYSLFKVNIPKDAARFILSRDIYHLFKNKRTMIIKTQKKDKVGKWLWGANYISVILNIYKC